MEVSVAAPPTTIDDIELKGEGVTNENEEKISPTVIIDPVKEKRVVWKLDLFIAPIIMVLQLISYLDRSNIGFAATQGLVTDIHLHGTQFNVSSKSYTHHSSTILLIHKDR